MSKNEDGATTATVDTPAPPARDSKPAQSAVLQRSTIVRSLTNPRTHFDEAYIKELATSIKDHGVIQPLLVRPLPASRLEETTAKTKMTAPRPTHEIVCGECRYRAAEIAGVDELPVLIRHLDDIQVLQIQLVENLKRKDLHPLEEAEGFERLVKDHSLTVEDVAARIGKSASYVYKLMKLLELTPECREILYQGKLSQSTALLVARAPAYLQAKIAKDIMAPTGLDQEPMSFRTAARFIQQHYMLRLADAVFDIKDSNLVAKAGPCGTCPRNTGANKDLFGDVTGGDLCTDSKCYDSKKVAHFAAVAKAAEAKGQKVIQGKEAKELIPNEYSSPKGYERLDASTYINGSYTTLRKALGKDAPPPTIIINPHTKEAEEVLPVDVANKLIKKAASTKKAQAKAKDPSKFDLEQEFGDRCTPLAIEQLHSALYAGKGSGITVQLAREIAKHYSMNLYGENAQLFARLFNAPASKVATAAGIEDFLDTCDEKVVGPALIIMIALDDLADRRGGFDPKELRVLSLIAADYGVDLKAIQDGVKAAMKAEAAERAAKDKAATPKKPAGGKPKKTTSAEAKAGIRQALQQADACEAAIGCAVRVKSDARNHADKEGVLGPFMGDKWKITFADSTTGRVLRSDFIVTASAELAAATFTFTTTLTPAVGCKVKIKDGLKGPTGHFRKICGRIGTLVSRAGHSWQFQADGGKDKSIVKADEFDVIEAAPPGPKTGDDAAVPLKGGTTIDPAAAWPFPTTNSSSKKAVAA